MNQQPNRREAMQTTGCLLLASSVPPLITAPAIAACGEQGPPIMFLDTPAVPDGGLSKLDYEEAIGLICNHHLEMYDSLSVYYERPGYSS